ncbi:MAG: CAP domain-containing protein, partial [Sarcina sp.]
WTNQAEGIGQYKGVTYYTEGSALQNLVNQDAFNLINQFRAQNGLAAYKQDQAAQYMATWKANNMAKYHYYAHVAGGTNNPFAGLDTSQVFAPQTQKETGGAGTTSWCENLTASGGLGSNSLYKATGIKGMTSEEAEQMAVASVNAWIDSPPHRANLLSGNTYMGVHLDIYSGIMDGSVIFGGNAVMDAFTPPIVGGTFNPNTFQTSGGHVANITLTAPNSSEAQALANQGI